jgi:AAA+ superfamily predicted ATPase
MDLNTILKWKSYDVKTFRDILKSEICKWNNNNNTKYTDFFIIDTDQLVFTYDAGIKIMIIYKRENMIIKSKEDLVKTVELVSKDLVTNINRTRKVKLNVDIKISYPLSATFTFDRSTQMMFFNKTGLKIGGAVVNTASSFKADPIMDELMKPLNSELDIIRKKRFKHYVSIPNGYIIPDDMNQCEKLIKTLFDNNIILSNQFAFVSTSFTCYNDINTIKSMKLDSGQALVIKNRIIDKSEADEYFKHEDGATTKSHVKALLTMIYNGIDMLPIFMVKTNEEGNMIAECAEDSGFTMINLVPPPLTDSKKAVKVLNIMARKDGFRSPFKNIEEKEYTVQALKDIYTRWKRDKSLKLLHPELMKGKHNIQINTSMNMYYDNLEEMIGLTEIKKTIRQIVAQFKIQNVLTERNISKTIPCRHMIFYGNPGTAKTTVARLLGQILASEGILRKNTFTEIGRDGLVAEYVGQTAVKTMKVIKKSRGGILFIDEAYSLVETKGYYGDECISTLVQQMDIIKDDTIIIFAGYPKKMEEFLDKNEGLRSRIGFHVKFDNYTKEELIEILKLMANKQHFKLTDSAIKGASEQIDKAINTKDFGNGRFIRNLLEQAMMKQAIRLVDKNISYRDLSTEELTTIDNIDIQEMNVLKERKLGF